MMGSMAFHESRQTLRHSLALGQRRLRYGWPRQKVFCVGFHKTGTISLQYALSLPGIRCWLTLRRMLHGCG